NFGYDAETVRPFRGAIIFDFLSGLVVFLRWYGVENENTKATRPARLPNFARRYDNEQDPLNSGGNDGSFGRFRFPGICWTAWKLLKPFQLQPFELQRLAQQLLGLLWQKLRQLWPIYELSSELRHAFLGRLLLQRPQPLSLELHAI